MSLFSYRESSWISASRPDFSALIMAALRKADADNTVKLQEAWPEIAAEFKYRYWSGGGLMPGEIGYDARYDDNLPVGGAS